MPSSCAGGDKDTQSSSSGSLDFLRAIEEEEEDADEGSDDEGAVEGKVETASGEATASGKASGKTGAAASDGDGRGHSDGRMNPWPEDLPPPGGGGDDDDDASFAVRFRVHRRALLYSYMGPILKRGAKLHEQRKRRGAGGGGSRSGGRGSEASGDGGGGGGGSSERRSRPRPIKQRTWRMPLDSATASLGPVVLSRHVADADADDGGDDENDAMAELSREDVYSVPKAMRARHLADVFWAAQRGQRRREEEGRSRHEARRLRREEGRRRRRSSLWSAASSSSSPSEARAAAGGSASSARPGPRRFRRKKKDPADGTEPFLRVLWTIARPTYLPAGIWQFVVILCQCSLPLLVRQVLLRLEEHPGEPFRGEGLPLAALTFLVSLVEGIGSERQKFLAFRTGITLRAAVVGAAHAHVLRMTPAGRAGTTSGEINNLVAVDAQKLFELTQEGHYAWSCPLAMGIVSALLLWELGPSALVGIATMFSIVPFVQWVVRRMMSVRRKRAIAADRRVESTSAMLQGIRFTKLNRYEEKFAERVMALRKAEVGLLRRELFYLALTIFFTVVSPVVASAFTFVLYALTGEEGQVLTPSTTFTSVFLFAALRFPINYAGKFMGKAAQGFQACHRFGVFFARDSLDDWGDDEEGNDEFSDDGELREATATRPRLVLLDGEGGHNDASPENSRRTSEKEPLVDVDASFRVGAPGFASGFTLHDVKMTVRRSEILCVVGPVASGKSTLVRGLIGELLPMPGAPRTRCEVGRGGAASGGRKPRVSYAAQVPFILNATVRDNVLFGAPYDEVRYRRVLEACCLVPDVASFHHGDLTEIGERGVTLSGGQKQRLSLARVAYSDPDVAILDDPLSALDAGTGRKVFERLFRPSGGGGLFANTAVVLVTHASHFLHRVDTVLVLSNGRSVFVGSWEELADHHPSDPSEADALEAIKNSVQEDRSEEDGPPSELPGTPTARSTNRRASIDRSIQLSDAPPGPNADGKGNGNAPTGDDEEDGRIMSVEERKFGLSQISTWLAWFSYAGGPMFFFIIVITNAYERFMYVATEWWLAIWTQGITESTHYFGKTYLPQIAGLEAQRAYIETYMYILLIQCVMTIFRINWMIQGGARCAARLFKTMLSRVLYAPMSYFDTTPIGRVMNRFTYDTETLDTTLVMNMTMLMTSLGWIFTGIILQSIILPWQLFAIAFIVAVYWLLVLHYRKSAVDLQRLDATSRSPVQAQLAEAIDGTSTMRVFGMSSHFSNVFRAALDENSGMMMNFMAAHRWLAVRIQMLGACSVFFSIAFVASFNDILNIDPGIGAILIIWSANFNIALSFFVQGISESEASMTSLERVLAMTEIPQEEDESRRAAAKAVDKSWPRSGDLTFEGVNLRYRPGLPLSLEGLTFTVKSGQRCGIVGRTGAGKSTLAAALFRLVELESGRILFDGVDISKIRLADVRGRRNGMTIIPQEPVLLPGTLKQCLDPFEDFTDDEVSEALQAVRGVSRGLSDILEIVEEGGRNFSVGERQLICLGRAMLARPRLLFLDEATASVDGDTDAHIQRMLRSRFDGTTLLTIAHRLNTIMDYDVILVVDKGKAAEFGTPAELLERKDSIFSELVESTGKESALALRSMVSKQPPR